MNEKTADISAIINLIPYLDLIDAKYSNMAGKVDIDFLLKNPPNGADKDTIKILNEYVRNNPEFGKYQILNISGSDGRINNDYIGAVTIRNPGDGSYYVSYRGTGDGKWLDNGEGMYEESTVMQQEAEKYFDNIVRDFGFDVSNTVIVTGHSKGGNEAQFVTMSSEYGRFIDYCYSIDGQGFSKPALEWFMRLENEDGYESYKARLAKMYSINGDNDYVHDLGFVIIPDEHTYFVDDGTGNDASDFANFHDLKNIININSDGSIGLIFCDADGNPIEQGIYGRFMKKVSEHMMQLPPEELRDCTLTIMDWLEKANMGDDTLSTGLGNVSNATWEEKIGFFFHGAPLIIKDLFTTKEGHNLIAEMAPKIGESIKLKLLEIAAELGPWGLLACSAALIGGIALVVVSPIIQIVALAAVSAVAIAGALLVIGAAIIDAISEFIANAKVMLDSTKKMLNGAMSAIGGFFNDAANFINSLSKKVIKSAVNFIKSFDKNNKLSVETSDLVSLRNSVSSYMSFFDNARRLINDAKNIASSASRQYSKQSYVRTDSTAVTNQCNRLLNSYNRVSSELRNISDGLSRIASEYEKTECRLT